MPLFDALSFVTVFCWLLAERFLHKFSLNYLKIRGKSGTQLIAFKIILLKIKITKFRALAYILARLIGNKIWYIQQRVEIFQFNTFSD